jgi:hypothetical protein
MSLSIGRAFDVYKPGAPDPFFLAIEHYGTRYARAAAPDGVTYGDAPLLEIAHKALQRARVDDDANIGIVRDNSGDSSDLFTQSGVSFNTLVHERDAALFELESLKRSRSRLFKQFMATLLHKSLRR